MKIAAAAPSVQAVFHAPNPAFASGRIALVADAAPPRAGAAARRA